MNSVLSATYRSTAALCAELVSRVPRLEQPMLRLGSSMWNRPAAGRFYRSVAGRYADRLRQSGSPFRRVLIGGTAIVIDVTEFTVSSLFFGNIPYEPATTAYVGLALRTGDVFVDIGANHGYFTILAAALVGPEGRVCAFEPNPRVFERLRTHVDVNRFEGRVTLVEQALSDASAEATTFYVSQWSGNSGVSSLTPLPTALREGGLSEAHTISVRTDTFDRWLAQSGLAHVDLVKIDTEGAEDLVVRGMSGELREHRVRAVICETSANSEADRLLRGAGLVPRTLERLGPLMNILYAEPGADRGTR
jgi:FkbM family methyltransferase